MEKVTMVCSNPDPEHECQHLRIRDMIRKFPSIFDSCLPVMFRAIPTRYGGMVFIGIDAGAAATTNASVTIARWTDERNHYVCV